MLLIGQYDSPFVRRVAIALRLYGIAFEHSTWSAFGDADKLREVNPLTRVPTLVLDDGDILTDSHMMLDYIDGRVDADRAMFPRNEPDRHRQLAIAALATGLGDKCVSLFYERRMHERPSPVYVGRLTGQIAAAVQHLEDRRSAMRAPYWFGDRIGHADIAVACVLRFADEVMPEVVELARRPALSADCVRLEATEAFREISQPFVAPA